MATGFFNRVWIIAAAAIFLYSCSASRKTAASHTPKRNERKSGQALTRQELQQKYAAMLDVNRKDINPLTLFYFIEDWYGTPYRYGGNDQKGVDCSGFVVRLFTGVYQAKVPRTSQQLYDASRKIKKIARLKQGDLVFFNDKGKKVSHVGVYLQNNYFVHASTGNGVMVSNLGDPYWDKHFICGGKLEH